MRVIWIGIGGFVGAVSRYGIDGLMSGDRTRDAFPWGTFVVNVSGCFFIGFVVALLTERFVLHPSLRAALTIGFLGAFTTFSTFAIQTMRLADDGAVGLAALNVAGTVVATLVAVYVGTWLGKAI